MYTPERIKRKLIFTLHAFLFSTISLILFIYIESRNPEIQLTFLNYVLGFYIFEIIYSIFFFPPLTIIMFIFNFHDNDIIEFLFLIFSFIIMGMIFEKIDFIIRQKQESKNIFIKIFFSWIYGVCFASLFFALIILPILILSFFDFHIHSTNISILNIISNIIDTLLTNHILDLFYFITIIIFTSVFYKKFNRISVKTPQNSTEK